MLRGCLFTTVCVVVEIILTCTVGGCSRLYVLELLSVTIICSGFVNMHRQQPIEKSLPCTGSTVKTVLPYIASVTAKLHHCFCCFVYLLYPSECISSFTECLINVFVISKVAELKKELADRGLPTKGNKSDLQARLEKCLSEQGKCSFYSSTKP